ncbi:LTA synthase family protein [Allopusillimonas ginsengisoli]|uniref:LTA synthase family protein n=1 Tax=Allopusillimonas ginsengisoli TaxID=453575 RepID=UPI0014315405|nr:LTA synthase family protein [Allopusillimonas ginsengisoli]
MWDQVWLPCLTGLLCTFILEMAAQPRPQRPWRRGWQATLAHLGIWFMGFGLVLFVFQRPWLGIANLLGFLLLLIIIGKVKIATLREPFIYTDFEYFSDAIRHPRLYLPFFGVRNALLGAAGYLLMLFAGLHLEPSATPQWLCEGVSSTTLAYLPCWMAGSLLLACSLMGSGAGLLWLAGRRPVGLTFDANRDQSALGLLYCWWRYRQEERKPLVLSAQAPFHVRAGKGTVYADNTGPDAQLPDIVFLQCESFFDLRRTFPTVRQDILQSFDQCRAQSLLSGRLHVPAWGANTVRTEYAVLSGIDPVLLKAHQYNPYRRLAQHLVPTLATFLSELGYRTICVHPYAPTFYRRSKAMPAMGFQQFLSLDAFAHAPRFGSYISDQAVAQKIVALLGHARRQPLFIYAITMENHGPLQWEAVDQTESFSYFSERLPDGCRDLVAYARHIANADRMIKTVSQALAGQREAAALCVFGDHVPIMPTVYARLGQPEQSTDYFCWTNEPLRARRSANLARTVTDLSAHQLSTAFLAAAGIRSS